MKKIVSCVVLATWLISSGGPALGHDGPGRCHDGQWQALTSSCTEAILTWRAYARDRELALDGCEASLATRTATATAALLPPAQTHSMGEGDTALHGLTAVAGVILGVIVATYVQKCVLRGNLDCGLLTQH